MSNLIHIHRLGGRLDLLVGQIEANITTDTLTFEKVLVYEDHGKHLDIPFLLALLIPISILKFTDSTNDTDILNSIGGSTDEEWDDQESESEAENGDKNMDPSNNNE